MSEALLWAFASVGFLATATALLALILLAWAAVFTWADKRSADQSDMDDQAYMRRLINDAWWFSEDKPTMNLLRRLGEGDRVDAIREDWRAERKGQVVIKEVL